MFLVKLESFRILIGLFYWTFEKFFISQSGQPAQVAYKSQFLFFVLIILFMLSTFCFFILKYLIFLENKCLWIFIEMKNILWEGKFFPF